MTGADKKFCNSNFCIPLRRFRGVHNRTEIIPFEPDAVRTAEGKSESLLYFLSFILFCACSFPEVLKTLA
jgi:hypothetical protein